eukprot:jgi/Tetstr1/432772/TSEL_002333.t1
MAPTRGKLGRGKTAGRGLGYLDGTLATAFHEVAFRLHLQEDLENQAGHAILAFLRGNAVRRATPDLAPTRHRIYERTRRKLADAGRHQAATKIQSKFKGHVQRQAFKSDLEAKHAACVCIQRHTRGMLARKRCAALRREKAALIIQRHERGRAVRARLAAARDETEEERRDRAAVVIQRRIRGFLTRKWYVRHFDARACCTCNSLADSEVLICNDCYEVYHLTCAGYSAEERPAATLPWYCHFCVAAKARHTVFLGRRRPDAGVALLRAHATTPEDLATLMRLVTPGGGEAAHGAHKARQMPRPAQHVDKLSRTALSRLEACRAKTAELSDYQRRVTSQVATLRAESHSDYVGLPPAAPAALAATVTTTPIFSTAPPEPLLPGDTYQNRTDTATSLLSASSKAGSAGSRASLPPMPGKPGRKGAKGDSAFKPPSAGAPPGTRPTKKRPVLRSTRITDPLHERQPKFPDYVQSREELRKSGTLSHADVLAMRKAMGMLEHDHTFGLDQVAESPAGMTAALSPELAALEE